jgi:hypothetical protein
MRSCLPRSCLAALLLLLPLTAPADIATARQTCEVQRMAVCDINGSRVYQDSACPEGSITLKPLENRDCTNVTWDDLNPPQPKTEIVPHPVKPKGNAWPRWLPYAALLLALAALLVLGITLRDSWKEKRGAAADAPAASVEPAPVETISKPAHKPDSKPENKTQAQSPANKPELVTVYTVNPAILWTVAGGIGLWGGWQISSRISRTLFDKMNHDSFAGLLAVLPQALGIFTGALAVLALLSYGLLRLIFSKKVLRQTPAGKKLR